MNILFVTTFQVSEQIGGTERTTALIASALRGSGHNCYNLYAKYIDGRFVPASSFDRAFFYSGKKTVKKVVRDYAVSYILFEGAFTIVKPVIAASKEAGCDVRYVFVHHFSPGNEHLFNTFRGLTRTLLHAASARTRLISLIKLLSYPVFKPFMDHRFRTLYKVAYDLCDKVVLLSDSYVEDFCRYANIAGREKFCAIPNALSFQETYSTDEIFHKSKQVLIVTRFDETQKRISLALKIWRMVEDDPLIAEWQLKIVGHGDWEQDYRTLAHKLGLRRASFEGRQDSMPYYRQSSLYMMTSLYEGWPMVLNEAMQFGCVPILFDTVLLPELTADGVNSIVVPDGDTRKYYQRMRNLMLDGSRRQDMAEKALSTSKKFTLDIISKRWEELLVSGT